VRELAASDLPGVEQVQIGATRRKILQISRRGLAFGTREGRLNGGKIIEVQDRNQMKAGWSRRRCNGTLADFVFSYAWDLLCDRNVFFKIMFVKGGFISRGFVQHYNLRHGIAPVTSRSIPGRGISPFTLNDHYSAALLAAASGS
jgi:hypothetical protein